MMSRSSARNSYVAKRPLMTITHGRKARISVTNRILDGTFLAGLMD